MIDRLLRKQQQSLDDVLADFYGSIADSLVDAPLDGDLRAIDQITQAIDE